MKKVVATPVAESIPFDNDGTTLTSENLQEAVSVDKLALSLLSNWKLRQGALLTL